MRSVTVLAPAKLNLTLDVTGTRPDGYHTLDMIMQAVSLRERVTLRRSIRREPSSSDPTECPNPSAKK